MKTIYNDIAAEISLESIAKPFLGFYYIIKNNAVTEEYQQRR